jgi:signal transduction histidine kinase
MKGPRKSVGLGAILAVGAVLIWRLSEPGTPSRRIIAALNSYEAAEALLERDVVSLRSGLIHNYDPLVDDLANLETADRRLATAIAGRPNFRLDAAALAETTRRQARLTEQLKSNSALLQNSLAYVSRLSAPASGARRPPAQVSDLAAAMLRLTLDTSPENQQEVARRLRAVEVMQGGDREGRQVLLGHARLLERLLPATDEALNAMRAEDAANTRRSLRAALQRELTREESAAALVRVALTLLSLLLLVLLLDMGLKLRDHVDALRRRARLERIVAEISAGLIRAQPGEVRSAVRAGLAHLGGALAADRAYLVGDGPFMEAQTWSRDDRPFAKGWPVRALELAAAASPALEGAVLASGSGATPPQLRRLLAEAGLRSAAVVWATTEEGARVLLGFDAVAGRLLLDEDELDVLRLMLDIVAGAERRCALERRRSVLERRLLEAGRMEAIGAFASGIAHNFNNILAAIAGYAEMAAERTRAGGASARNLDEVQNAVVRGRDLADRILAFGQRRAAPLEDVRIVALLEECASLLRAAHERARIVIARGCEPGTLLADPGALQQILLNLGANAIQASPGDGEVRLSAERRTVGVERPLLNRALAPGDYVVLAVEDDGDGIDPRMLPRIFDPFFTTRHEGHGLGLATVGALVRDHGGAIDVRSAPGRGTRFEVWLPRRAADRLESGGPARGDGQALLLVCEDPEVLRHAEELVAAVGYEPLGFTDAEQALAHASRGSERFEGVLIFHGVAAEARRWAEALRQAAPGRSPIVATCDTAGRRGHGATLQGLTPLAWPAEPASLVEALRSASSAG